MATICFGDRVDVTSLKFNCLFPTPISFQELWRMRGWEGMRIPAPSVLCSGTLTTVRDVVVNMKRPHVWLYSNCKVGIRSKSVWWRYEGESINRSQMNIKRKTYYILTWKKYLFIDISSTNIDTLVSSLNQGVETDGVEVFWLSQPRPQLRSILRHQRNVCHVSRPSSEPLYSTNTSHSKQEIFLYEYPLHWVLLPTEYEQQDAGLGSYTSQHGRHFDYWNQPLNMRICVCCLDCHEAGLCSYLVIHIENLLRPLQLFCFHLWPIYWLSLVY
jgi:hypothetical protein